jgi:hypothetical protein
MIEAQDGGLLDPAHDSLLERLDAVFRHESGITGRNERPSAARIRASRT